MSHFGLSKAEKRIYDKIPKTGPCVPGCSICCELLIFSRAEAKAAFQASGKRPFVIQLGPNRFKCGYVKEGGGCEIYEVRPFLCRIMGAWDNPNAACPHGVKAEKPLTRQEGEALKRRWKAENGMYKGIGVLPEVVIP